MFALLGGLVCGATMLTPFAPEVRAETASPEGDSAAKLDRIVFTNGNVLECRILDETPSTVRVQVFFNGKPMTEQTYQKTQIIELQRGVGVEASVAAVEKGLKKEEVVEKKVHPDAALIYMVEFDGTFGSDISETPVREVFEDVDRIFDDLIPAVVDGKDTFVVDPEVRDKHVLVIKMDCGTDQRMGFDGIWRAKDMGPLFTNEIKKGRRVVFWIKEATDGAAMLPWFSPEMYFDPDGHMYFTSDLEAFDIGDDVVDEKQISLRLGEARGWAIAGGYEKLSSSIIKTMTRSRYWLYYKEVGGEAVFHEGELTPEEQAAGGWILLSDNGKDKNEDKGIRVRNDRLVIDAELAHLIDLSDGTAKDEEGLMYAMGVHRNYKIVEGRAERIFEKWTEAKEAAFERINGQNGTLWIEFQRIEVDGDYTDRARARGLQQRTLERIYSDFSRFAEVWDPDGGQRGRISVMIERIRAEQQADKAAQRG
jgi:hypothetical protein